MVGATISDAVEKKDKLLKTMKEVLSDIVLKPNFIVYGVIDKGCLAICYGSSTSGKTFFIIDLAFAIVRGVPWRGKKVKKGKVLYICAEGYTGVTSHDRFEPATHAIQG